MNRQKIAFKSALVSYINMFFATIIGIVSQPMILNNFGVEEFGIWTLALTLITYVGNTNVGIPGAALVMISKSDSDEKQKEILIKSTILMIIMSIIALIIFIFINCINSDWIYILGDISPKLADVAKKTIIISTVLFLIRSPFQIAQSAFSGFQDIHINKIYEVFNTIAPFLGLVFTIILRKDLIGLGFNVGIVYLIVNVSAFVHLIIKYNVLKFGIKEVILKHKFIYKEILKSGIQFFFIGIAFVIIYNTDYLVISNILGAALIAKYAFAFKLYQIPIQIMNVFTGIAFPMYGKAYAKKEYQWIQQVYDIMVTILPILAGAVWIGGMLISRDLLEIWARDNGIFESYILSFILGAFIFSLSTVNAHSTLLTGIDKKKEVVKLIWVESTLNLGLSIIFVHIMGISGVALGTAVSSILVPFIFLPRFVKKNTNKNIIFNYKIILRQLFIAVLPLLILSCCITSKLYNSSYILKIIITTIIMILYFLISYFLISKDRRIIIIEFLKRKRKETI